MQQLCFISDSELVRLCTRDGSPAAWEEFIRRFHRPVAWAVLRTLQRWGGSAEMADDLVQEVFLKLCSQNGKLLRDLSGRASDDVQAYCRVIATNVAHDHLRSERTEKRGGSVVRNDIAEGELALSIDRTDVDRSVLLDEIDRALTHIADERDRYMFWLYYRQGLTAAAIARIPGIMLTQKGVESALLRLIRSLRSHFSVLPMRSGMMKKGKPSPTAF